MFVLNKKKLTAMKYLPLYKKWLKEGSIPNKDNGKTTGGLCSIFTNDKFLDLMRPIDDDDEGYWGVCDIPWEHIGHIDTDFTPLRQNIVLFMAAMNNEL